MDDKLTKFAAVVEHGSFSSAARSLHISQPALSIAIKSLESELKTQLFTSREKPLKLTAAGKLALERARSIREEQRRFRQDLAVIANKKPALAVGMIDSLADALFVKNNYQKIIEEKASLELSINNSSYLLSALKKREIDAAYIVMSPDKIMPSSMTVVSLGTEPLVTVASSGKYNDAKAAIKNKFISDFLSYDLNSNTARIINNQLRANKIRTQTIFNSTSPEILLHLVLSGKGTATLPLNLVLSHLKEGAIRIVGPVITRPITSVKPTANSSSLLNDLDLQLKEILRAQNASPAIIGV